MNGFDFVEGKVYSNDAICASLRCTKKGILRHKVRDTSLILCGCFDKNEHPDAPDTLEINNDKKNHIYLKSLMLQQPKPIPIFTKEGKGFWKYHGCFRVVKRERVRRKYRDKDTIYSILHMQNVKIVNDSKDLINYDLDEPAMADESKERLKIHLAKERSRKLVLDKKADFLRKNGRLYCEACGFDFADIYGERGEGFIECHHLTPISQLEEGQTTTLEDLALLCSNCHRMIHREQFISVIKLKEIIKERQKVCEIAGALASALRQ